MFKFISVLFSPTATFQSLKEKGGWWPTAIILSLFSVLATYLITPLKNELTRRVTEKLMANPNVNPSITSTPSDSDNVLSWIFAVVVLFIMIFIVGGLLKLVSLFVRGEATYMQCSKVALFSYVPVSISSILGGIIARTSNVNSITSIQEIYLSLGMFMQEKKGFLFHLISSITNPLAIWSIILMIIGMSVMSKRSRMAIGTWIVVGWLILSFISSGLILLSEKLMGMA